MSANGKDNLPDEYRNEVVSPVPYEPRRDAARQCRKTWGYDPEGGRLSELAAATLVK